MNDGISSEVPDNTDRQLEELFVLQTVLNNIDNSAKNNPMLNFKAQFCDNVQDKNIICDNLTVSVLFDTGALCSNYISKKTYEKIKKNIPHDDIKYMKTRTSLADDVTTLTSNTVVVLTLELSCKANTQVLNKFTKAGL